MNPDEIPATANSRSSKEELKKQKNNVTNRQATQANQVMSTPSPPETQNRHANPAQDSKSAKSAKSKSSRVSGSAASTPTSTKRELKNRQSNQDAMSSGTTRTPLSPFGVISTRTRDSKKEKAGGRTSGREAPRDSTNPSGTGGNDDSRDVENPPPRQSTDQSTAMLQAEVAPDLDAAIQTAVQNALQQRDQQIITAVVDTGAASASGGGMDEPLSEVQINEDDSEAPKAGATSSNDNDQGCDKKMFYAGVGLIVLIVVIVLAATLSGGDDGTSSATANSNAGDNSPMTLPTIAPAFGGAPSTSPAPTIVPPPFIVTSAPSNMVPTPTILPLSGDCNEAIPIMPGYQGTFTNTAVTETYSNTQCGVRTQDNGIWFHLQVPPTDKAYVALLTVADQYFSAKMSFYSGSSCGDLQCIERTFSSGAAPRSLELLVASGASYYIFVAGNGSSQVGTFQFSFESIELDVTSPPSREPTQIGTPTKNPTAAPTNLDLANGPSGDCNQAIPITPGYQGTFSNTAVTATFANTQCSVWTQDQGIWFHLQVPPTDRAYVALLTVADQSFSAKMSFYAGSNCGDLQCVDRTSSSGAALRSLELPVASGASYYILVAGNGPDGVGTFRFSFESSELDGTSPPSREPTLNDPITQNPTVAPTNSAVTNGPQPTVNPTSPSPVLPLTPQPTLLASPSGDCKDASVITPGFSQGVSTLSGLDTFVESKCVIREGDRGVWFKYTPQYEAAATLRATNQNFSAKLAYFTGPCELPTCGDRTTSTQARDRVLNFYAEVGKVYYLFVGGNGENNKGSLQLTLVAPVPPASSYCDGAIEVRNTLPYGQTDSSLFAIYGKKDSTYFTVPTISSAECKIDSDDRGTWYKYVPTRDVILTVSLNSQERNTRMAYFTGNSCGSLKCGDFIIGSVSARSMTIYGKPGEVYYILVASNGYGNVGDYRINIIESLPPESSYFTGATEVTADLASPFVKEDNTRFAVPSFSSDECRVKENDRGIWYQYSPTVDAIVTVTLSGFFSKQLSMYTGNNCVGDVCESLSCVQVTSRSVGSDRVMEFHAKVGFRFFFLVSGSNFEEVGEFTIRFDSSESPLNSYCSNAVKFSSTNSSDAETHLANTMGAVPSFSSDTCSVTDHDRGLWYKYTPMSGRMVQVTLSDQDWIARLSYYSGDCSILLCGSQTGAAASDRFVTFHAMAGVDYYFLASGRNFDQAGSFEIAIDAPEPSTDAFCTGATELSTVNLLGTTLTGDSTGTVPSFADPSCEVDAEDRGVWFRLPAGSAAVGDAITAQVTNQLFVAKLSVFESADGSCGNISCVTKTSWSQFSSRSATWVYTSGKSYYVLVSGNGLFEAGTFSIKFWKGFG